MKKKSILSMAAFIAGTLFAPAQSPTSTTHPLPPTPGKPPVKEFPQVSPSTKGYVTVDQIDKLRQDAILFKKKKR